jgi:hypothetical protein
LHAKVRPVATAVGAVGVNLIPHAPASTAWLAVAVAAHVATVVVADLAAALVAAVAEAVALAAAVVVATVAVVAAVAVPSAVDQLTNFSISHQQLARR